MQQEISKTNFKAQALEIMRGVEDNGEELIITNHGKPTLIIKPYRSQSVSPLERLKGTIVQFDNPTEPVIDDSDWDLA